MLYGMSGAPIPADLPYAAPIAAGCEPVDGKPIYGPFPPLVAYAVACRESIIGEINGKWNAASVVSADSGHGLFQLTSSWPDNWDDPAANAAYAVRNFLRPALAFWRLNYASIVGDDLVRCIAASFNAGIGGAVNGHNEGDVDKYTTDRYGAGVLAIYRNLCANGKP